MHGPGHRSSVHGEQFAEGGLGAEFAQVEDGGHDAVGVGELGTGPAPGTRPRSVPRRRRRSTDPTLTRRSFAITAVFSPAAHCTLEEPNLRNRWRAPDCTELGGAVLCAVRSELPVGSDEPRLVSRDDQLGSVPGAQFCQDAGHVRLDGLFRHDK